MSINAFVIFNSTQLKKMKQTSEKYYIDKTKTWRKSIIVFKKEGVFSTPIIYISKPKYVTQEEFDKFINNMQIIVPND